MKYFVLYNPLACSGKGFILAKRLENILKGDEVVFFDVTTLKTRDEILNYAEKDDRVVLCGGDGTLNRFINSGDTDSLGFDLFYFACGSGNDFSNDLGKSPEKEPVRINKYLKHLPTVLVNGKAQKFLNGIGFGIDGYCCEEGDRQRAKTPGKRINYTRIAIKGLLGAFKPLNATVSVDGVSHEFKKVWLAPTMNGRFYGGGMMPTPAQDRERNGTLSTLVFFNMGPLGALTVFPSIFTGEHTKYEKNCVIFTGKNINVHFDRPCALQIDGETVKNVTDYTVCADMYAPVPLKEEKETAAI